MNVAVSTIGRCFFDLPQRVARNSTTHRLITTASPRYDAGIGSRQMVQDIVIDIVDDFRNRFVLVMMRIGIENWKVV